MSVFDLNTTAAPTAITGALENPTGVAVDKRQALRSRLLSHFKITNTGLGYRMLTPATVDAGKLATVLAAGTRAVRETDYYFARSYRGRGSLAATNLDESSPERSRERANRVRCDAMRCDAMRCFGRNGRNPTRERSLEAQGFRYLQASN